MVDGKSKMLFWVMAMLIVLSVSASYYRFMVLHDYVVEAQIDCDPTFESCFVWECDPSIEGECTGNEEEDTWYYKIAHRNAKNITGCEDGDTTCQFTCPSDGEEECDEILCSDEALATYDVLNTCTNPDDFQDETLEETEDEEVVNEEELVDDTESSDEQIADDTISTTGDTVEADKEIE